MVDTCRGMDFIVFYKVGMKIKQTILSLALFIGIGCFYLAPAVSAVTCGGVTTSIIGCDQSGDGSGKCPDGAVISKDDIKSGTRCSDGSAPDTVSGTGIWGVLLLVINILTAGIGVAAVGGIVYASVLYATARGGVDQTKKAIVIIQNVVIGIVAYVLMFAFLNYIIPGGLFQK